MTKKTTFMIATGTSVVVVRDGKRQTIQAGSGTDFTAEEIASIHSVMPGVLRKPVNESRPAPVEDDSEDADEGDEGEADAAAPKETAKEKKARLAAEAKAAAATADEDEDI